MDDEDTVTFRQLEQADYGVNIVTRTEIVPDFIEELCKQMDALAFHHFIAKSQAAFLSSGKANLTDNCAIILLDFAENF